MIHSVERAGEQTLRQDGSSPTQKMFYYLGKVLKIQGFVVHKK